MAQVKTEIIVKAWEHKMETTIKDWERADDYFNSFLMPNDPVLEAGKFLHLLVRSIGAKRVLEIGTLGGYSTIWFARALPDNGEIITLELVEHHAKVATENIEAAGLTNKVNIIVGRAVDTLEKLDAAQPFDLVFIDADKPSNLEYYNHAKRLTRKGGVINASTMTCSMLILLDIQIVDNMNRGGLVSDLEYSDAKVEGVRRLLGAIKADTDVDSTVVQHVGTKGYDGFLFAFKK
ncbi:hypothetical protein Ac2012v2_005301 [Leucoagaricus gongylophorus]